MTEKARMARKTEIGLKETEEDEEEAMEEEIGVVEDHLADTGEWFDSF